MIFLNRKKTKTVGFIVGCQRSGTTMLTKILARSPHVSVYGEANKEANKDWRLRDEKEIKQLIRREHHELIIFKPLNDTQYTDRLLLYDDNAKAIWIYRCYQDTVNSAVTKWQDTHKKYMLWISRQSSLTTPAGYSGEDKWNAIYIERMPSGIKLLVNELAHADISNEEGAALLWYVRNRIYFDLNLSGNDKVMLVKYEDLVTDPLFHVRRIATFLETEIDDNIVDGVVTTSINKHSAPVINPAIRSHCDKLMNLLDRQYMQQLKR